MFLTRKEVAELTGYVKPYAQIRWLTEERIGFMLGGDGHPRVLREVVLARLGAGKAAPVKREPELRFS